MCDATNNLSAMDTTLTGTSRFTQRRKNIPNPY